MQSLKLDTEPDVTVMGSLTSDEFNNISEIQGDLDFKEDKQSQRYDKGDHPYEDFNK